MPPHSTQNGQAQASVAGSKYLRISELSALRNVAFSSRRPAEGVLSGRHRSPQRGHSVEFNDYREYIPGDEVGDVDWKVYGRSDRLYVKLFENQVQMNVRLLIDASASMAYVGATGPRPPPLPRRLRIRRKQGAFNPNAYSKYDHACRLAAAIAFLTVNQQDSVGLGLARDGLQDFHRPASSVMHLARLLRLMESGAPAGNARLSESLRKMAPLCARRGLLILFSDLMEDREDIVKALAPFLHRGSEVIVFHVLHKDERELPQVDSARFVDSEDGTNLTIRLGGIREEYGRRMKEFIESWAHACRSRGVDYNLVDTSIPYIESLQQYLFRRASLV